MFQLHLPGIENVFINIKWATLTDTLLKSAAFHFIFIVHIIQMQIEFFIVGNKMENFIKIAVSLGIIRVKKVYIHSFREIVDDCRKTSFENRTSFARVYLPASAFLSRFYSFARYAFIAILFQAHIVAPNSKHSYCFFFFKWKNIPFKWK